MITGSEEYKQYLLERANSYNSPNILVRIPVSEPIYKIDLDTRVIEAPKNLGVEADHEAEYIYFICDRYYDNFDLSQSICAVQFENAKHEEYLYLIPAYDILSIPGKMIFAWDIQSPVTKYGGNVQFSFKFFKIDKASGELLYELNTQVCKTKVLTGWASKNGINHTIQNFTVNQILTDADLVPVYDTDGNPIYEDFDGNILTYTIDEENRVTYKRDNGEVVPADNVRPQLKPSGYSFWSKVQSIYDTAVSDKYNVYWIDLP